MHIYDYKHDDLEFTLPPAQRLKSVLSEQCNKKSFLSLSIFVCVARIFPFRESDAVAGVTTWKDLPCTEPSMQVVKQYGTLGFLGGEMHSS